MILTHITLSHFRNFEYKTFAFSPELTIIIGQNARGKTSLLESIYFIIYGTGFRESREEQLLNWEHPRAVVEGVFNEKDTRQLFQIMLQ